ncbi:hypothetical protein [Rhodococcoides kyotonense]|uniref:Uncharacterized protein n=1 Tax=Rhodococcoides kyotonense TaxID=398843 RepID=A0A239M5F0_9NOCA|nr:hypothetical protein [Rhodococcus kyotonensis]SNT38107.1 hypothetical protein SAMN05421642_11643 [Rhodococcus kyotonensis]
MSTSVPAGARPGVVNAAYVLWLIAAVLLVLVALLTLTVPVDQLRPALEQQGTSSAAIDSYLSLIRVVGVVCAVLGLVVGFLAGPVRAGHGMLRRALVGISIFAALVLVLGVLALGAFQELLAIALVLLVACMLVYRPSARSWFHRE